MDDMPRTRARHARAVSHPTSPVDVHERGPTRLAATRAHQSSGARSGKLKTMRKYNNAGNLLFSFRLAQPASAAVRQVANAWLQYALHLFWTSSFDTSRLASHNTVSRSVISPG